MSWPRDWSSDLCSSDLQGKRGHGDYHSHYRTSPRNSEPGYVFDYRGHGDSYLTDGAVRTSLGTCEGENRSGGARSEEHTSELQSRGHLVCRLLLEKKKEKT